MAMAAIFLATIGAVAWHLLRVYNASPATKWTAVGALFAGAALIVAAVGLPLAVTQLFTLEREVNRASGLVDKLKPLRRDGLALREQLRTGEIADSGPEVKEWVERVVNYLLTDLGDDVEADTFKQEGKRQGPGYNEITAKLAWLRDNLLPKVMAGYW